MRSFENHDMLRLSVLIDNFILILFIYWSGSLYNIFSGSIFILMLYKLPFLFDLFTLHTLAKSMMLLWIVLVFFLKKCSICDTIEKLRANFEAVRFFCSVNWSHKDFILIFYSYTLSTLYMQNFLLDIFFLQFLYTQSVKNLCIDWWGSLCIHLVRWATFACVW